MKSLAKWIKLMNESFNLLSPLRYSVPVINSKEKMVPTVINNDLVVVVLGATAAGKSKLAIDVASRFNGEIISADSIQMYKGLDIITNKVTKEERNLVKHHLIDFVDPLKRLTVVDFRHRALKTIEDLLCEKKLPVIVGGTNYYIESLLWDVLVDPIIDNSNQDLYLFERDEKIRSSKSSSHPTSEIELTKDNIFDHQIFAESFKTISSAHLYNILKEIDPEACSLYHPHDRRKIIRALQVIQSSGGSALYSSKLKEQQSRAGGDSLGGPLRFINSVILWTSCDREILVDRIDERVEKMMQQGLLNELIDFHKTYNEQRLVDNSKPVYSEGIFQAIGFKEFHEYLIKPEEKRKMSLLKKCVTQLKVSTRQYARKQVRWIENRFISATDRNVPDIYALDTSELEKWDERVKNPAFEIVSHRLNNLKVPDNIQPVVRKERAIENVKKAFFCDICQRTFQGSHQFQVHLKSKLHANVKRKMTQNETIPEGTKIEAVN